MDELTLDMKASMEKTLVALKHQLTSIRTGRASVALLDKVMIDYYGEMTPIAQLASVTIPEPRQLLIKPYDKDDMKKMVDAISSSDLSIHPIVDTSVIRLNLPALTEERRLTYAKQAKKLAEDAKIAIRSIRKDTLSLLTDDEYTEDLQKRIESEISKVHDEFISLIEKAYLEKEKDILTL